MSLTLVYCAKEWRAQRGLLLAYSALVYASLGLVLWMLPSRVWHDQSYGAQALAWFVACGVFGVLGFVAPTLVRGEFTSRSDQFVRRLPGALWPSFTGKLLFLVLACFIMPLCGLCVGQLFLSAIQQNWQDLYRVDWSGQAFLLWPQVAIASGLALLLAPWVWAVATWLPRGRMAIGGTAVLVLMLGAGTLVILRGSPGIERGVAWQAWLWAVVPLGLASAAMSWGYARRGGGLGRSALWGLLTAGLGLMPAGMWLGVRVWRYHHPDPQALCEIDVQGISPDGHSLLLRGSAHPEWAAVTFHVDLRTGHATQITDIDSVLSAEVLRPYQGHVGQRRHWRCYGMAGSLLSLFDLDTLQCTELGQTESATVPPEIAQQVRAELRAHTLLRAPDDSPVWFEPGELCQESAAGAVTRQPLAKGVIAVRPAGHGFRAFGACADVLDWRGQVVLTRDQFRSDWPLWIIGNQVLFVPAGRRALQWHLSQANGAPQVVAELAGCQVFGLFDHEQLLCSSPQQDRKAQALFLYRPATGQRTELTLPANVPSQHLDVVTPLAGSGTLLARDPSGCIWLRVTSRSEQAFVRLNCATREIAYALPGMPDAALRHRVLAWPDAQSVLITHGTQVMRVDLDTGAQRVLFPRTN